MQSTKGISKLKKILGIALATFALNSYSYDISGITIGNNYEEVKSKFPSSEIKTWPHHKGGEYGFMWHQANTDGKRLTVGTRPDDSIYDVRFYQEFPVKQSESIKKQLCKKYNFNKDKCFWSVKYEDLPANRTDALFSAGNRSKSERLDVKIKKAMEGRSVKEGFIAVDIRLETRGSEIKRWEKKIQEEKQKKHITSSLKVSEDAPEEVPTF